MFFISPWIQNFTKKHFIVIVVCFLSLHGYRTLKKTILLLLLCVFLSLHGYRTVKTPFYCYCCVFFISPWIQNCKTPILLLLFGVFLPLQGFPVFCLHQLHMPKKTNKKTTHFLDECGVKYERTHTFHEQSPFKAQTI